MQLSTAHNASKRNKLCFVFFPYAHRRTPVTGQPHGGDDDTLTQADAQPAGTDLGTAEMAEAEAGHRRAAGAGTAAASGRRRRARRTAQRSARQRRAGRAARAGQRGP